VARTFPDLEVVSADLTANGLRQLAGTAVCCTAEQLALRSAGFRTVVLSEVLEHVGDPEAVLAECRRVGRPDARLVITVPALPLARAEHLWRRRKYGVDIRADNVRDWDPEHERRYTEGLLTDQLHGAGWEIERVSRFFGSATTAAIFAVEPRASRLARRPVRLAPRLHWADRLLAPIDCGSEILVVARPAEPR
jgi:ubiquinone/menaquinone biosynthesis C-methylase UbiE